MVDGFELFTDRSVVAMRVNGELRDLATTVTPTDAVEAGHHRFARRAEHPPPLRGACARAGRAVDQPGGQARHRPARRPTGSTTTSTSRSRSRPRTSRPREGHGPDHPPGPALHAPGRDRRRGPRRAGRRAVQARADRAEGRGRGRVEDNESVEVGGAELTIYDNVDPKTGETVWKDLCRGPHLPNTRMIGNGYSLTRLRRRLLARLGEEPAAAARLRHRLADQGRTARLPGPPGGGRQARPPQARRRARPVQLPRRDRLRPAGLPPQGRHHPPGDGGLLPQAPRRGRLRLRLLAAHHQGEPVRDSAATSTGTPTGCSRRCTSTRNATKTATSPARASTTTSSR